MCQQHYNRHSCTHSSFVKTKTCCKKPHCPHIRKVVDDIDYICENCAAHILMSMRAGVGGGGVYQSQRQNRYQHQHKSQHQYQYRGE